MLIIAVVLAVIGLASLVAAVATSNEIFAWVCIASSAMGVILLAADAAQAPTDDLFGRPRGGEPDVGAVQGAQIFSDGFESGNTFLWSLATPPP